MKTHRIILAISVIAALAAGFGGGLYASHVRGAEAVKSVVTEIINRDEGKPATADFSLFWDVWEALHAQYVDKQELDAQVLMVGAIEGMVHAVGDPYTVYLEPVSNKDFQEQIKGSFGGVGMEVGLRDDRVMVIAPLKGTPAYNAGIKPGDFILEIDGVSTEGMTVEEAVTRIRGEKGTSVRLLIYREGVTEKPLFTIVRDVIKIPAVEWKMIGSDVAYLQLFAFNQNIDDEFAAAAREILASGATRLIVDVRNNPGGLLDSAVNLSGWLLPRDSVVVREDFGSGMSESLRTTGAAQLAGIPTVFLINGGSASAAEILAGAAHDIRNVPLVGEKTFGKGSVQQLEPFPDGSSLKVTVAKWLTPNGVSISETGIEPTVPVELSKEGPADESVELGTPGKDTQLDKAIEVVRGL